MHTETHVLSPVDSMTFRSVFARDNRCPGARDPLDYFYPTIERFGRMAIGQHFWFILDFPAGKHCACGGDVEYLTPFTLTEFSSLEQVRLHGATHPDDLHKALAFSRFWIELYDRYGYQAMSDLAATLFFRLMNPGGEYNWIMVQYPDVILNTRDKIVYGLVLVTDISHIKSHGEPMMNILHRKDRLCERFFCVQEASSAKPRHPSPRLTQREKEILQLMARGHGSKQIASALHISTKTVDNHRQNMLHKTGSRSSSELVSLGIRLGMIQ